MSDLPQTRYVKSGEVHIAYQVLGDGPIDLLWVPGFVSHWNTIGSIRVRRDSFGG
jgi:hypothetical protein